MRRYNEGYKGPALGVIERGDGFDAESVLLFLALTRTSRTEPQPLLWMCLLLIVNITNSFSISFDSFTGFHELTSLTACLLATVGVRIQCFRALLCVCAFLASFLFVFMQFLTLYFNLILNFSKLLVLNVCACNGQ